MPFDIDYLEFITGLKSDVLKAVQNGNTGKMEREKERLTEEMFKILVKESPNGKKLNNPDFRKKLHDASDLREVAQSIGVIPENTLKVLTRLFNQKNKIQSLLEEQKKHKWLAKKPKVFAELLYHRKKSNQIMIEFKKSLENNVPYSEVRLKRMSTAFSDPKKAFEILRKYQSNFQLAVRYRLSQEAGRQLHEFNLSRKLRINPEIQKEANADLEHIISEHRSGRKTAQETADDILILLKENQERHEKTIFSTASTFNLKTIKELPDDVRQAICEKLHIPHDSPLFKEEISYKNRKELATKISNYDPSVPDLEPDVTPKP